MAPNATTRLCHVNDQVWVETPERERFYIGRFIPKRFGSSWCANPYRIGPHGTREEVLRLFVRYTLPALLADPRIEELRGKLLGCWCRPPRGFRYRILCHGQYYVAHLEGCRPNEVP